MTSSFEKLLADAVADARDSEGWDFTYLRGRRHSESPPWSYDDMLLSLAARAEPMLDMDTGGGERLRALHERAIKWPSHVSATEGYLPNVSVARGNLEPIGIAVQYYEDSTRLPIASDPCELIANRHGAYIVEEIVRILTVGGTFITQQVGSGMCKGLNRFLHAPEESGAAWDLLHATAGLQAQGLKILDSREYRGYDVFDDVGAVAWYLAKVPWQIPGFSIETYYDQLWALHRAILERGPIDFGNHHFLIVAEKLPATGDRPRLKGFPTAY